MPPAYGYSLEGEAVAFLLTWAARKRRLLLDAFEQLARHPFATGDFYHPETAGRICQVFDVGDFIGTCWREHAAKVVRVLLIEKL